MKKIIKIILLLIVSISYSNSYAYNDAQSFDFKRCPDHFYISTLNSRLEQWRIYTDGVYVVWKIEYTEKNVYHKDVYFFKNEEIVYILIENNGVKNGKIYGTSNIQYYLENKKLIDYSSLGSGPVEHDNWNPKSIYKIYNKRVREHRTLYKKYIDIASN